MFDNLRADYARVKVDRSRTLRNGGWKRSSFLENVRITLALTTWCVISYRFSRWVFKLRIPVIRQLLSLVAVVFQRWVELWTAEGHIDALLAKCSRMAIATAALNAAIAEYPGRLVTLRQRTRVIDGTEVRNRNQRK